MDLAFAFEAVSLSEFLYASRCVDEFLLPGKERVTVRTDIDMDVAHRGAGFRGITASTDNLGLLVLWMNAWFHTNLTIECCLYHTKIALQIAAQFRVIPCADPQASGNDLE